MDSAAGVVVRLAFALVCVFGAIADNAKFGDWKRMRMWTMAIFVAIVGPTYLRRSD